MADILEFPNDSPSRHTVLIADDEPLIRDLFAEALRASGFFPVTVPDGDAAIEMIEKRIAIDVIVSDVRMPGTHDGFALARWVAANRPDIPIILVSGDFGKNLAASDLIAVPMLKKPIAMEVLVQTIRQTIDKHWKRVM